MKIMERGLIRAELVQRQEEGCDIEEISTRITAALDEDVDGAELVSLYDELMELPIDESFSYVEPSTLGEIHKERPAMARKLECSLSDEAQFDRTYGAWPSVGCPAHVVRGLDRQCQDAHIQSCRPVHFRL